MRKILLLFMVCILIFLTGCRSDKENVENFYEENYFEYIDNAKTHSEEEILEIPEEMNNYRFKLKNDQGRMYTFYNANRSTTVEYDGTKKTIEEIKGTIYSDAIIFHDDLIYVLNKNMLFLYDLNFNIMGNSSIYELNESIAPDYQAIVKLHDGIYAFTITGGDLPNQRVHLHKVLTKDDERIPIILDEISILVNLKGFARENSNINFGVKFANFKDYSYFLINGNLYKFDTNIELIDQNYYNVFTFNENGPSTYLKNSSDNTNEIHGFINGDEHVFTLNYDKMKLENSFNNNNSSYFVFVRNRLIGKSMWNANKYFQTYVLEISKDFELSVSKINKIEPNFVVYDFESITLYSECYDYTEKDSIPQYYINRIPLS
jgi:hypothetical protein